MELTTLYKQYRAAKMAADQAAKEEDKLKKALKKARTGNKYEPGRGRNG